MSRYRFFVLPLPTLLFFLSFFLFGTKEGEADDNGRDREKKRKNKEAFELLLLLLLLFTKRERERERERDAKGGEENISDIKETKLVRISF